MEDEAMVIGVAWYTPLQWKRLKKIAADPCQIDETYEDWLQSYDRIIRDLNARGMDARRVPVNVDELEKWCAKKNRPNDSSARSEFAVERLRQIEAMKAFSDQSPEL